MSEQDKSQHQPQINIVCLEEYRQNAGKLANKALISLHAQSLIKAFDNIIAEEDVNKLDLTNLEPTQQEKLKTFPEANVTQTVAILIDIIKLIASYKPEVLKRLTPEIMLSTYDKFPEVVKFHYTQLKAQNN